jgi:hypothetical protein
MFRRNPDLIATIAVALYLFVGTAAPSMDRFSGFRDEVRSREEIAKFVKAEIRSILRELALAVRPICNSHAQ